jgi:hypothetical protein
MLDFSGYNIPDSTKQALTDYIERGIQTGGFLYSVLSNDLMGAIGRADKDNFVAIKDITGWVYNEAPAGCWGNEAVVLRWMEDHPAKKTGPLTIA